MNAETAAVVFDAIWYEHRNIPISKYTASRRVKGFYDRLRRTDNAYGWYTKVSSEIGQGSGNTRSAAPRINALRPTYDSIKSKERFLSI